ncbi:hypothetical protein QM806_04520 [Rhodococcus sp. IEGM 1351]|uniref:hypothetical protein n=1 Tax=Rhodococcus sp. IEGM 1351 TaxID=3047089 RepID=UPI0024B78A0E|nr:hypothetical protein [Rhodococcus sp. IEGM 1351]MDI9934719.1 hypothetical protein [Rhodococcus sp. IEGM 1351]
MNLPNRPATIGYWLAFALAGLLGIAFGWRTNEVTAFTDDWTSAQWGPAAAWVAGFLTFGAVSVSLWQALEARKKNAKDALAAEERSRKEAERHAEQLHDANTRLENELTAQRNAEQLRLIPPIWPAVDKIVDSAERTLSLADETKNFLKLDQHIPDQHRITQRKRAEHIASLARDRQHAVESMIMPAALLVSEPDTMASIQRVWALTNSLQFNIHVSLNKSKAFDWPNDPENSESNITALLNELSSERQQMFVSAREKIAELPPIPGNLFIPLSRYEADS